MSTRPLFERLAAQANREDQKREVALRERDRTDALVAEAVSAKPTSRQWYAFPGELSIDEAVRAIGGGPAGLHARMDRYRKAQAEKAKTSKRSSSSSSRTQARRAATSRAHQP